MARQIVVLALVLIALVGLVSADTEATAAAPGNDDSIGNTDEAGASDAGAAVEGPIGSEEAANSVVAAAQPPSSGATTLRVSAVAAAAAVAGYFVF